MTSSVTIASRLSGPASSRRCSVTLETGDCRMEYLRRELDDPEAAPCGRCDNCTGVARTAGVSSRTEDFARARLRRPGVTVTPRRIWPTGMAALGLDATGRIPAGVAAEPGRCVGRLTDIGWGSPLRKVLADGAPDEPVPGELFDAVLAVLAAWDWAERPAGVVTLPSRSRPRLISDAWRADRGRRKAQLPGQPGVPERRGAGVPVQQRPAAGRVVAHPGHAR